MAFIIMRLPGILKRAVTCVRELRLPSICTHFASELESKLQINGNKIAFCRKGRRKILFFKTDDIPGAPFMMRHVLYVKDHLPKISGYIDFKINTYDTVIDIGAHLGFFSVYAANIAREGNVYSLEPSRRNFERLKYHQKLNRLNNIVLINKGVSDREEKTKLYLWASLTQRDSMVFNKREEKISHELVDCVPLKRIFDEYKIEKCDFLKIDCEGMEYRILRALPEEYFKRIKKISLEYHPNGNVLELAGLLHERNYKVIINGYPEKQGHVYALRHAESRIRKQV